jgi:hypothetical protein
LTTVEVLGPKGPVRHGGVDVVTWARRQLELAGEIVDNPGGGLLFATQTMGQVKVALADADAGRWGEVVRLLDEAEDAAVRRRYGEARNLLDEALGKL